MSYHFSVQYGSEHFAVHIGLTLFGTVEDTFISFMFKGPFAGS